MTHANLTRWIKAADTQRFRVAAVFERTTSHPSKMRGCLHSAVATIRPVADLPIDHRTGFSSGAPSQRMPGHGTGATPVVKLATMIGVALVVLAGLLTFDLLVLWITAGRLIARLPF